MSLILSLESDQATLALVGGKGLNLARLAQAGLPVPGGFMVTTEAYRRFADAYGLAGYIAEQLQAADLSRPAELERVSAEIRAQFAAHPIPTDLAETLRTAYARLGDQPPVAVRSSATAEDLPDLSFAGQQDTYLNVIGPDALLTAVVNCWSSLWTARAIGYRARNAIPQAEVTLAVIVQYQVPSQASGVLFTANPLTGLRRETVIDATLGLGEALVSGLVEPDHYVVDTPRRVITSKTLGAKALIIQSQAGGGTVSQATDAARRQALPDAEILALADLGQRVAALYDTPQDIEWAWTAAEGLHLLQSRAITSLYPIPERLADDPTLHVLFSFGAVQGLLDPMTPLGQDTIQGVFAGAAAGLFHIPTTLETQKVIYTAGERLWADVTALLRHPIGRRLVALALSVVEPSVAQTVGPLLDDPRLTPQRGWFKLSTAWRIARFAAPALLRLARTWARPAWARVNVEAVMARYVAEFPSDASTPLAAGLRQLDAFCAGGFSQAIRQFVPVMGAGMSALNLLRLLTASLPEPRPDVLLLTRGLPHNVTTEMDLALWQTARVFQADAAAYSFLTSRPAPDLAAAYQRGQWPPVAQQALARFLAVYGRRGLGEIDLGRVRWGEDPTPVIQALQSYVQIRDDARAPDKVFAKGSAEAEATLKDLVQALRPTHWGWFKARLARIAAHRARGLAGLRESPKFFMITLLGEIRASLLTAGRELVAAGRLNQPDDMFFLHVAELRALARGESRDWAGLAAARRQLNAREQRRRQIPRVLLNDGRAFYEGIGAGTPPDDGTILGMPVSPGMVEGQVRVVLNPHGTQLLPGEILVCPGTDPSWTPLFLAAGGLVMEVGGLMTHGSVVAREYGIPAVVGVHEATTRLQTGQRVRVDGSQGRITLLDTGDIAT